MADGRPPRDSSWDRDRDRDRGDWDRRPAADRGADWDRGSARDGGRDTDSWDRRERDRGSDWNRERDGDRRGGDWGADRASGRDRDRDRGRDRDRDRDRDRSRERRRERSKDRGSSWDRARDRSRDRGRARDRDRDRDRGDRRSRRAGGAGGGAGAGDAFAVAATDAMVKSSRALNNPDVKKSIAATRRAGAIASDLSQPEVHIIGEVVAGEGYGTGVTCKFIVQAGTGWKFLQGNASGQTQVDYPAADTGLAIWAHPIDVHYVTRTTEGWPRILVQVWKLDSFGRNELRGYGFAHIPSAPGSYEVEVPTWRPVGSVQDELLAFFLGGYPQLKDTNLLYTHARDRFRLVTESTGKVHAHFEVVVKNFDKETVEW